LAIQAKEKLYLVGEQFLWWQS